MSSVVSGVRVETGRSTVGSPVWAASVSSRSACILFELTSGLGRGQLEAQVRHHLQPGVADGTVDLGGGRGDERPHRLNVQGLLGGNRPAAAEGARLRVQLVEDRALAPDRHRAVHQRPDRQREPELAPVSAPLVVASTDEDRARCQIGGTAGQELLGLGGRSAAQVNAEDADALVDLADVLVLVEADRHDRADDHHQEDGSQAQQPGTEVRAARACAVVKGAGRRQGSLRWSVKVLVNGRPDGTWSVCNYQVCACSVICVLCQCNERSAFRLFMWRARSFISSSRPGLSGTCPPSVPSATLRPRTHDAADFVKYCEPAAGGRRARPFLDLADPGFGQPCGRRAVAACDDHADRDEHADARADEHPDAAADRHGNAERACCQRRGEPPGGRAAAAARATGSAGAAGREGM